MLLRVDESPGLGLVESGGPTTPMKVLWLRCALLGPMVVLRLRKECGFVMRM